MTTNTGRKGTGITIATVEMAEINVMMTTVDSAMMTTVDSAMMTTVDSTMMTTVDSTMIAIDKT